MTGAAGFEIRRAMPADAAVLTRLAHVAKRYWRYPEELMLLWKGALTVSEDFIERSPVYCAMRDGEIAGFYALRARETSATSSTCGSRQRSSVRGSARRSSSTRCSR